MPLLMTGPEQRELEIAAEKLLRRLKINGTRIGQRYIIYAVCEVVRDPCLLLCITKTLYPTIAKRFSASPRAVERAIRTTISASWEAGGGEVLSRLAGCPITSKPTNAEFIDLVAAHIRLTWSE